jgi:hypothetical protein
MQYTTLVAEQEPNLLIKAVNNQGMETRMHYALDQVLRARQGSRQTLGH